MKNIQRMAFTVVLVLLAFTACTNRKPLNVKELGNVNTPPNTQFPSVGPTPTTSATTSTPQTLVPALAQLLSFFEGNAYATGIRGPRRAFVPLHHRAGWADPTYVPAVDCVVFNVSHVYATPQSGISEASVQRVGVFIQHAPINLAKDTVHQAPEIFYNSFELPPGGSVTVNFLGSTATGTTFPKAIKFEATDIGAPGLIQADCYIWRGNPSVPADRLTRQHAVLGGLPF